MNLPNLISLARLFSVPLVVWLILVNQMQLAFFLFLAAGVSDAIDGFLAKQFNARTELGSYLDPIADKTMLVAIYITLGFKNDLPSWLVILVVSRDFAIVGGALLSLTLDLAFKIQPLMVSKINTTMQILLVGVVLADLGLGLTLYPVHDVLVYVVAGTTIASWAGYLVQWVRGWWDVDEVS